MYNFRVGLIWQDLGPVMTQVFVLLLCKICLAPLVVMNGSGSSASQVDVYHNIDNTA